MRFLLYFLALACLAVSAPSFADTASSLAGARHNVVVIMLDDLEEGPLEALADAGLMPNFNQRFVIEGSRFVNSFVTNSLCCPSRATFLTGQYTHNHGVFTNFPFSGGGVTALDDASTLPVWLQAAGYRTGYIGKYLNGYGENTEAKYIPPGWDDWQVLVDPGTYQMYGYVINDNGTLVRYGEDYYDERAFMYQTDVIARRAKTFIEEANILDDIQPFFMTVMPFAPHLESDPGAPLDLFDYSLVWTHRIRPAPRHEGIVDLPLPLPSSFNEADVSDKPDWVQSKRPSMSPVDIINVNGQYRSRLASLLAVDDLIGDVFEALQQAGELDNTLVVLTSDNGYLQGEHRSAGKLVAYEEAIRVPLYIRGPEVAAGQLIEHAALNNDLAPTLVDLAGATADIDVDGRSLLPLLALPAPTLEQWRSRFLIEHYASGEQYAVEVPYYNAIRTVPTANTQGVIYVDYPTTGEKEYYNLNSDPGQMVSRHDDVGVQDTITTLQSMLRALKTCAGASCVSLEGP